MRGDKRYLLRVKEVAELVGISVRTLHHYDEIGLLSPKSKTAAGYRLYSAQDLQMLQQILFFRELGFSLKKIAEMISNPDFDRESALLLHRDLLIEQRRRLDRLLATVELSLRQVKGEIDLSPKQYFQGFDFSHNPYEVEARKRWGDKAVDSSNQRVAEMTPEQQSAMGDRMAVIYDTLAKLCSGSPSAPAAQAAIKGWYDFINQFGDYPPAVFRALGQMYVDDPRFTENIDRFGTGLAVFMRDAMGIFAANLEAQES